MRILLFASVIGAAVASPAGACGPQLELQFTDSSPHDVFVAVNKSIGDWRVLKLTIDLESSAGDLIFDTAGGGEGFQAYHAFRDGGGTATLTRRIEPTDGGRTLALEFASFDPGGRYSFGVDLDDRLPQSVLGQTYVTGGELSGARASAVFEAADGRQLAVEGRFDPDNRAVVSANECMS